MENLVDSKNLTLSVIIPVYNSEPILPELIARLTNSLTTISTDYEIILVNDGSCDNSWKVIAELTKKYEKVRGFNLMRNYGQHNALLCGIRSAKFEIIVTIDDDLQHPPEEIPRLLAKLDEGFNVVYGAPEKEKHSFFRNIASQMTKIILQNAMGADTARHLSAFRVFHTYLREGFEDYQGSFVSIDVLLTWATSKFTHIYVKHNPRTVGQTNYTIRKLIAHAFNMITGFSTLPLQLASIMGFSFTFLGLIILIYVIARYIYLGGSVPGFPFIAGSIAIFSGAQLFTLGIIGEYLARIYTRTLNRPPYKILLKTEAKDDEK